MGVAIKRKVRKIEKEKKKRKGVKEIHRVGLHGGDQVKEEADIVDEQSQDRVQFSLRRLSSYIFSLSFFLSFFQITVYEGREPISYTSSGQWAFQNYGRVIYIFPTCLEHLHYAMAT